MELFKLFGSILIDNKDAEASLQKTEKSADGFFTKLGKGVGVAGKVAAGLGGMAVAGGGVMLGLASQAGEAAKEIDKMASRVGFSTTAYQEWDFIAQKAGTTMDTLQGGITDLAEKMDDAAAGTGEAKEIFDKLGISVTDSNGNLRDQQTVFEETMTALMGMENATERQALATKLMSTTGEELLPLLNGQIGSIDSLKTSAHELGAVLSEDAVGSGVKFQNSLEDIRTSFGNVMTNLAIGFMPILQQFLDWVIANMPTIQKVAQSVFTALGNFVTVAANIFRDYLLPIISSVVGWVQANWPTISAVIRTVFNIVSSVIRTAVGVIKGIIGGFSSVIGTVKGIFESVKNAIMSPVEWVRDKIKGVIDTIKGFFDFKISWPKIPMPKFGITPTGWKIGDLLKGSIPRLGITWNREGGIFDQPTIFGTRLGFQGVGEAGPEAILPIKKLQEMVDFNSNRDLLIEQNRLLKALLDKDSNLYVDGDRLTEKLHEPLDQMSGFQSREKELAFGGAV